MLIWLFALLLAAAAQDQPPQTCTLSGHAINSVTGAPLGKVEVLAEAADRDAPPASTTTDAKGNFTLVELPAGQYRLKGHRNGYVDTYYGARRAGSGGTVIALEAGQELKDAQIKLLPFGVIAGTVRDTDGEPMSGAAVMLFRQQYTETGHREVHAEAETVTDDQGQYRVTDLEPGKYFIKAEARSLWDYGIRTPVDHSAKSAEPPPALLPTVYPGTVEVTSGGRSAGIDITLQRSKVFRVTVHATAAEGLFLYDAWLYNAPPQERFGLLLKTQNRNRTGEFEFHGVPPGAYTLEVRANSEESRARMPLLVGGDMEGVRIAVGYPAEVTGHVRVEGSEKVDLAGIRISFDGGSENAGDALIQNDSSFGAGLFPGQYQVYFEGRNLKLVVKSMRAGGVDVYQKGLTITEASKAVLEIVLAPEGGQVDGVVLDKDEKPVSGATVVMIAEPGLRARHDSYHEETTDAFGRYHFDNVRPGDYKLFAWDDVEPYVWFDPDFMKGVETGGEAVTIAASGHSSVQLHVH